MDNPYVPPGWGSKKKSGGSPGANSFQKELKAKMQDRKRLGMSADLSQSDDDLPSDDDLMTAFNITSKKSSKTWQAPNMRNSPMSPEDRRSPASNRSKSPYDSLGKSSAADVIFGRGKKTKTPTSEDDLYDEYDGGHSGGGSRQDLMMTLKQPLKPNMFGKTLPNPKSRKGKHGKDDYDDSDQRRDRSWSPPNAKKHERAMAEEEDKENLRNRSKSPRGRRTPTSLALESIEEERKPRPSPRLSKNKVEESSRPKPQPRGRTNPKSGYAYGLDDDDDDEMSEIARRHSPMLDKNRHLQEKGRKTPDSGRQTPTDVRRRPSDSRNSPLVERDYSPDRKKKKVPTATLR